MSKHDCYTIYSSESKWMFCRMCDVGETQECSKWYEIVGNEHQPVLDCCKDKLNIIGWKEETFVIGKNGWRTRILK